MKTRVLVIIDVSKFNGLHIRIRSENAPVMHVLLHEDFQDTSDVLDCAYTVMSGIDVLGESKLVISEEAQDEWGGDFVEEPRYTREMRSDNFAKVWGVLCG